MKAKAAFPSLLSWLENGSQGPPPLGFTWRESRRRIARWRLRPTLIPFPYRQPEAWLNYGISPEWRIPVQTRRGCSQDCAFCSTSMIEGRQLRWRSAESVVNWLASYRNHGFRDYYFVDNTFNVPLAYAKELCRKFIEARLDIDWWAQIYPR